MPQPKLISVEHYKANQRAYRPGYLYERKQVYYLDVPAGTYWHNRPIVKR